MKPYYWFLLLFFFTHESLATKCNVNGNSVTIGPGVTTNIPVSMGKLVNAGSSITLINLLQQLTCTFENYGDFPSTYTDNISFSSASTLNTAFSGSGITGWFIAAGSQGSLPAQGQNIRVANLKNNGAYVPINVSLGLNFPLQYNKQVSIKQNDIIATLVLMQTNNYDSSGGTLTINLLADSDTTINVRGCEVSTGLNQTVQLPQGSLGTDRVTQRKLSNGAKDFSFALTCDAGTKVLLTPSGTVGPDPQPGVYANQSTDTNAAKNMGIAVECQKKGADYQPLLNNTTMTMIDVADTTENIPCRASYYNYGNATAGTIKSSLTLSITYQ